MIRQHEVVGQLFRGTHRGIYLCTRWVRAAGYDMRLLALPDQPPPGRDLLLGSFADGSGKAVYRSTTDADRPALGSVCNVSERAIGRTFHRIDTLLTAHESGCECNVCVVEEVS